LRQAKGVTREAAVIAPPGDGFHYLVQLPADHYLVQRPAHRDPRPHPEDWVRNMGRESIVEDDFLN
jgi:hypothetical protein